MRRVERAHRLLADFLEAIGDYTSNLAAVVEFDPETCWTELRLTIADDADPVPMALIMGDALHNLRSALDYLVWQLVLEAGNQPSKTNCFLIAETEYTWKSNHAAKLAGVDPAWIEQIQKHQPFEAPVPGEHWLARLERMNNVLKHRLVPPSVSQAKGLGIPIVQRAGVTYDCDFAEGRLDHGSVFFRVRGNDSQPVEIAESAQVLWRISFDDQETGEWDLAPMLQEVESLLSDFASAFWPNRYPSWSSAYLAVRARKPSMVRS